MLPLPSKFRLTKCIIWIKLIFVNCRPITRAGIEVPMIVDLELNKYLNNRGKKKLMFDRKVEIKDPFGVQERF